MEAVSLPPVTAYDVAMGWFTYAGKLDAYNKAVKKLSADCVGLSLDPDTIRKQAAINLLNQLVKEYQNSQSILSTMVTALEDEDHV